MYIDRHLKINRETIESVNVIEDKMKVINSEI